MDFDENRKLVRDILRNYISVEYWDLFDWDMVIDRRQKVDDNVLCFDCHFIKLYFDEDMTPVTYKEQRVINDKVYYDMNNESSGAGTLTYLGKVP